MEIKETSTRDWVEEHKEPFLLLKINKMHVLHCKKKFLRMTWTCYIIDEINFVSFWARKFS